MSDIYSDSIYLQIKMPCKKHFPSPVMAEHSRSDSRLWANVQSVQFDGLIKRTLDSQMNKLQTSCFFVVVLLLVISGSKTKHCSKPRAEQPVNGSL